MDEELNNGKEPQWQPAKLVPVQPTYKTLRDEMAIAALAPLMETGKSADQESWSILTMGGHVPTTSELEQLATESRNARETLARQAYKWADAMLEARESNSTP